MSKDLIYKVKKVSCELYKRNPPLLSIEAEGEVNSGGWTDPELRFGEIKNGTVYIDFYAKPPEGPAIDPILAISCSATFNVYEPGVSEVVIRSKNNSVTCTLDHASGSKDKSEKLSTNPCKVIHGSVKGFDLQAAINDAISNANAPNGNPNISRRYELLDHYYQSGGITGPMTFVSLLMC